MAAKKENNSKKSEDASDNNVIAALSYLGVLCLVPLFLKRDSKFAQAHAKQGLLLFIAEIVGMLIIWIPFLGLLLWLVFIVLSAVGIAKALKGEPWEIPYLGKYANKLNI